MTATLRLEHSVGAPRLARRWIIDRCREWHCDALAGPAALMISELVTNAFLHARTDCLIHAAFDPPTLIVTVTDQDEEEPSAPFQSTTAEGGRGLAIVSGFADNWGTKRLAGGKSVWFHLSNTDQPPHRPVRHL